MRMQPKESEYKLSIIVPIGAMSGKLENLESWIRDIPESGVEIIFICDDKQDGTYEEIKSILNSIDCKNIKLFLGKYGNPGGARNAGLDQARGEWIAFWDSDDLGKLNIASKLINDFDSKTTKLIVCRYVIQDVFGITESPVYSQEFDFEVFKIGMNPGIWRMFFSRDLAKSSVFNLSRMGEDQVYLLRCLAQNPELRFSNQLVYVYHKNVPNQLTSSRVNIDGLIDSMEKSLLIYRDIPIRYIELAKTIIIKQFITGIIRGSTDVRLKILRILLRSLLRPRNYFTSNRSLPNNIRLFLKIINEVKN